MNPFDPGSYLRIMKSRHITAPTIPKRAASNRFLKCDEVKPFCGNCQRLKLSCPFQQYVPLAFPSRQPDHSRRSQDSSASQTILTTFQTPPPNVSPPTLTKSLSGLPLQFSTLDLELLHFYTTTTSHEILGLHMTGTDIFKTSIVTLAFQHPFLLSSLFSLSALHLVFVHSRQNPAQSQKYTQIAAAHQIRSISGFRAEIQNLTPENSAACCACAQGMALLAWTQPGAQGANLFFPVTENGKVTQVPWYKLHQGGAEVLKRVIYRLERGEYGELVHPWTRIHLTLQPQVLSAAREGQKVDQEKLDYVASCWNEDAGLCREDKLILDETLNILRYVFTISTLLSSDSPILSKTPMNSCFATLLWIASLPPRFCELIEERCPQALVLIAVWCVLLKRVGEIWWVKGKAKSLLRAVWVELGGGVWDEWLMWPVEEVMAEQRGYPYPLEMIGED